MMKSLDLAPRYKPQLEVREGVKLMEFQRLDFCFRWNLGFLEGHEPCWVQIAGSILHQLPELSRE